MKLDSIEPIKTSEEEFRQMDEIAGILYKNKSDESDEGSWINSSDFHKVASAIWEYFKKQSVESREVYENWEKEFVDFCMLKLKVDVQEIYKIIYWLRKTTIQVVGKNDVTRED